MPSSASRHSVAPAKINLGLSVLRRRSDGFHDIETVLLPIGWHDLLHVAPSNAFRFTCSDSSLPTDERNLCVRAAHLLMYMHGYLPPEVVHPPFPGEEGAAEGGGRIRGIQLAEVAVELGWAVGPPMRLGRFACSLATGGSIYPKRTCTRSHPNWGPTSLFSCTNKLWWQPGAEICLRLSQTNPTACRTLSSW